MHTYINASCKKSKSLVVTKILDTIRASSRGVGGGFIRKDRLNKRWYEVKEKIAREKIGQALRDASVQFLKNKGEGGGCCVEDSMSIPALVSESPRNDSVDPRDTPTRINLLLEPETKKRSARQQFIPEPPSQSTNQPGWYMQSPGRRINESYEMLPIVAQTKMEQVVCRQDLSAGPPSDFLIDKQNRSRTMTTKGSASMMVNFWKAATNLKEDWNPAWAPLDFEPTPLLESTPLKQVPLKQVYTTPQA